MIPAIKPGSHLLWEKPKNNTIKINDDNVNLPRGTFCQSFFTKILAKKFLVKNSSIIGVITTNDKILKNRNKLDSGMNERFTKYG